jgi:hypothetical protein
MLSYSELNRLRRAYTKQNGEAATSAIIAKHGGKDGALATVPDSNWPALARDFGFKPGPIAGHVARGDAPQSLDDLDPARIYARWNSCTRNPNRR